MLEYRADSLHPALGAVSTAPELVHRRIVTFAALVGCDRSDAQGGLRLSPSRAIEFVRSVPDGVDPLDVLRAWAEASAAEGVGDSPASVAAQAFDFEDATPGKCHPLSHQEEGRYVKGASMLLDHTAKVVVA